MDRKAALGSIDFHFSTIGIGDVFLTKPRHMLPQSYYREPDLEPFLSWEIIGNLKEEPEDFNVQEIAPINRKIPGFSPDENDAMQVAHLHADEGVRYPLSDERVSALNTVKDCNINLEGKPLSSTKVTTDRPSMLNCNNATSTIKSNGRTDMDPKQTLEILLHDNVVPPPTNANINWVNIIISELDALQDAAQKMLLADYTSPSDEVIASKSIRLLTIREDVPKELRGDIHRLLRSSYVLLKSEGVKNGNTGDISRGINVSIDDMFLGLAPFLAHSEEDLLSLYTFYAKGYVSPPAVFSRASKRRRNDLQSSAVDQAPAALDADVVLRLNTSISKDDRRTVHTIIAKKSNRRLTSSTVALPQSKGLANTEHGIAVHWAWRSSHSKARRDGLQKPNYRTSILFAMRKRQREHHTALQNIAKAFGCRVVDLSTAGIKDFQAVTYQFITAKGVAMDRILKARSFLKSSGYEIGRVHPVDFCLKTGDLKGNRFEIIVRNYRRISVLRKNGSLVELPVDCDARHVDDMFNRVRNGGFVNFFGEQRVGDVGPSAVVGSRCFDIGKALLRREFRSAVNLIMTGRIMIHGGDTERDDVLKFRRAWADSGGDPHKAWNALPRQNCLQRERIILNELKRYGKEKYEDALLCVPYNQRNFWINAYQSYVWNTMATARLEMFGTEPIKGDLVMQGTDVVLYKDDSDVTLFDVVLPLPGSDSQYPDHTIGELYEKMLKEDGIEMSHKSSRYVPKGSYRSLVVKAENMSYEFDSDKTVKFSFDLPKGSYATMLFRELMVTTISRGRAAAVV